MNMAHEVWGFGDRMDRNILYSALWLGATPEGPLGRALHWVTQLPLCFFSLLTWSHFTFLISGVILVHILTSEVMELRTTDEREYCDIEVRNTNIRLYSTTMQVADSALVS